jgi:hypothetical protein
MNANPMGALRPAHSYLPPFACVSTVRKTKPQNLTFRRTDTGIIVYQHRQPVAWIVQGYHCGQLNQQPKTCHFVDVAYHRQTTHGINLETADFETVTQAVTFINGVFGGAA